MATLTIEIGKLGAKGTMSVNLLVCQAKTKKRIKTGIKLEREEVTASGKIKNRQKAMALEQIRRRYEDKMESLRASILDWSSMDASTLVELLTTSKRSNEPELFEFVGDWMENANIKGAKNYKTMLAKIREYTKCGSLLFSKINYEFLLGFERHLKGKPRAQSLYLGQLRHVYREAMRRYNAGGKLVIKNDPFISYRVPKQQIKKGVRAITLDQLMNIYEYKGRPHSRAELARDCFILSFCLMGMNSVDMYECGKLKKDKICYNRAKTKNRRTDEAYIEVDIHPFIKPLMKKYKSGDKSHVFNFHERYANNMEFNRALNIGLKDVGDAVGIKGLQFYQARHTFATLSRNLMRFSKGDVDEALNHVGSFDIADIYIAKDFSIINENNKKLIERVFSSQAPISL